MLTNAAVGFQFGTAPGQSEVTVSVSGTKDGQSQSCVDFS